MKLVAVFCVVLLSILFANASEVPFIDVVEQESLPTAAHQFLPARCGAQCKFRMCNFNGTRSQLPLAAFTILGEPRAAPLPYVCRPGVDMGVVLRSGEAKVRVFGKFVPISKWNPTGLQKNFKRSFIKTFKEPFLPHSGIGRLVSSLDQWSALHNQCMILPIKKYQIIDLKTGLARQTVSTIGDRECVSFRTRAPAIQVQLTWDTQDDFDLEVVEPDGDLLNLRNTRSEYGKLNNDNNAGFCGTDLLFGRENVLYFPNPNIEVGRYKIRVIHFKKCSTRPTNWKLKVIINGVVKLNRSKFSAAGGKKKVGFAAFNWP